MKKIAFLFPGQGAQYPGMGKDFVEAYSIARQTFEEADDVLKRNLSSIVLEGPEATLIETRNSQTGIYVMSMAVLRVVQKNFPVLKPHFCAGLSLGEYSALTAAGMVSFQDCLKVVERRGFLMNEACMATHGTMAAVLGLDSDVVEDLVRQAKLPHDLWVANLNCPGQVVISGTIKGVEAGSELIKAKGAKRVIPLTVHGAFHSGLMQQAEDQLTPDIMQLSLQKGEARLVMNVEGVIIEDLDRVRNLLIKQVTSPVRWEAGIKTLMSEGVDLFIEMGCGKTLAGLNKKIGAQAPTISIETVKDLDILAKEFA